MRYFAPAFASRVRLGKAATSGCELRPTLDRMILPTRSGGLAAACVLAGALATACAADASRPQPRAEQTSTARVMVKLLRASEDGAAIAAEARRVAGVPVTYAAAASPNWHALVVHCNSAAECERAIARLRAAGNLYQTVEIDERKTRSAS